MVSAAPDFNLPEQNEDNGTPVSDQLRDAIIFVPGLSQEYLDQSVDCISRKIVNALDRHTKEADAIYLARDAAEEEYREGLKARKRTILRKGPTAEQPFVDIYELKYEDELTKLYKAKKPISQAIALFLTLASNIFRVPNLLRGTGKTKREKLQIIYSMGILGIMTSYVILLIIAALSSVPNLSDKLPWTQKEVTISTYQDNSDESMNTVAQSIENAGEQQSLSTPESNPPPKTSNGMAESVMDFLRNVIVLLTGLGLLTSAQLKGFIKNAAIDYSCAIDYLSLAERKRAILGHLSLLVEHVAEVAPRYKRIHIISYSFGSLIALDALYSADGHCRRYDGVDSLVTIGCPFDLVRTCWPEYFADRVSPGNVKRRWLNIYNPVDVLGSNFRDDGLIGDARTGIEVQSGDHKEMLLPENMVLDKNLHINGLSFMNLLALRGLKVHACYWNPDDSGEISCFDEIIRGLYPGL